MGRKTSSRELDETLVTSDLHLLHANILPYCNRPWLQEGDFIWNPPEPGKHRRGKWVSKEIKEQRAREMTDALTENWNMEVRPGDTTYHIGDFCLCRWMKLTPFDLEQNLNGKVVHIVGNHDRSNGVRGLKYAMLEVMGHSILLIHRPIHRVEELPDDCDIVFCGHVHEKWAYRWVEDRLLLNVGVDVRGFYPWRLRDAIAEAERLQDEAGIA